MKKYAVFSLIFDFVAIALFIVGMLAFGNEAQLPLGSACVSGGFVFLGVGIYFSRKTRNHDENGQ